MQIKKLLSLFLCVPALLGLSSCTGYKDARLFGEIINSGDPFYTVVELGMYIGKKCEYGDKMDRLSAAERVFYVAYTLEAEVNNGGFSQFFFNSSGEYSHEIVDAFTAIGAHKTAEICKKAVESFGVPIPTDRQERFDMLEEYETDKVAELLSMCDGEFYSLDEDLCRLEYDYIMAHRDEFTP